MSKVQFNSSDSVFIFEHNTSSPVGRSFKGLKFSEELVSAMSTLVNSYDYSEDVYVTLNVDSVSFTSVTRYGALTVAVARNSPESFTITKVVNGNVSVRKVDSVSEIVEDAEDEFYTILVEVCREYWSK